MSVPTPAAALIERAAFQLHLQLPADLTEGRVEVDHGGRVVEIVVRPAGSRQLYEPTPPLSPVERHALEAVRRLGGRATWRAVLADVARAGLRYSETHLRRGLARLVADGLLRNDHDGRGYYVP